jgi:hypothetical protein
MTYLVMQSQPSISRYQRNYYRAHVVVSARVSQVLPFYCRVHRADTVGYHQCRIGTQKLTERKNFTGPVNLARYLSNRPVYHDNLAVHRASGVLSFFDRGGWIFIFDLSQTLIFFFM